MYNFDICKCLLQDPMHILIEGVCINELKDLLGYLINEKGVKLTLINRKIAEFKYFFSDIDDLPNIIDKKHVQNGTFALSAGQILTLIMNLPFILGDLFNTYDENWLNLINLHQIVNLVIPFFYDDTTVTQLKDKISQYLENFKLLYTNSNITPKMHYMSHFPSQMENFGPLRHHACFRFESKNGLLKSLRFQNFINIPYSVSDKHQVWIAGKENEFKKKIRLLTVMIHVKLIKKQLLMLYFMII